MPELKQTDRLLSVKTPLGDDVLLADRMALSEALSKPFVLQLDLIAENEKASQVDSKALIGQPMTLSVKFGGDKTRHVHGIVSRFTQVGKDQRVTSYRAEVVPRLWLFTLRSNCRVFQDKTAPDILREVLSGIDVSFKLTGTYRFIDYCVQYRETDFNFVSRLMEDEGISYYFKHTADSHTLVLVDSPDGHDEVPSQPEARYTPHSRVLEGEDIVTSWEVRRSMVPGKYTSRDYNFQMPDQTLENSEAAVNKIGGNDKLEIYDYPAGFALLYNKPDERLSEMFQEGPATNKLRIQAAEAGHVTAGGSSTCRAFLPGFKFTLTGSDGAPLSIDGVDGEYLITSVRHSASQSPDYFTGAGGEPYRNVVTAIPADTKHRPARVTPRPVVRGMQTAVVVGPAGEEIFVDKYGRVKVQFHWDRQGRKDEDSSCWVRVAQSSAGTQWGAHFWPRMGHEVLVSFMEGDPDQPIIVGSVYNNALMPPYALPDNKTRSGIKTRSTLKGQAAHFNELRFEDKKGEEEIYLHAEKDFNAVIENNETRKVGFEDKDKGDQNLEIFNNQIEQIGADKCEDGSRVAYVWNNDELAVGQGEGKAADGSQLVSIWKNQELTVGKGKGQSGDGSQIVSIWKDRAVTLETGNDNLTVSKGNRDVKIDMGNESLTIKMGNQTTKLNLGKSDTEAMQSITLKVGQSSVKIDQTGVSIEGMMIKINGQVQTDIKGLMTNVNGTAMLKAGGGITMIG